MVGICFNIAGEGRITRPAQNKAQSIVYGQGRLKARQPGHP
jgi:hypothetical protein